MEDMIISKKKHNFDRRRYLKKAMSTYMKCYNIPLLWRKYFLNIANTRDHIIKYYIRPFFSFHKPCREYFLGHNSDDNEIRVLDDNLNIMFYASG